MTTIDVHLIWKQWLYIIYVSATDYWIGGRDDVIEGTWQWSSTDSVFTYNDWFPGEPSNSYNAEDCLELNARFHWKWNDSNCTIAQPFICEKRYAFNWYVQLFCIMQLSSVWRL